ncbi:MAG: sulfatase-like hydrolase/transferase [Tannerellaceae bacterium]
MMTKKNLLLTGCLLSPLFIASGGNASSESSQRPHIILIMADDMGWGDVGFNGNKMIKTPVLDALAVEGVRMDHFYSAGPLSSPTRASVLTGRNPFRTGVFSANEGILRPEEVTLPELLRDAGYRTGHFGKWHLGTLTYQEKDANRGCPENKHLYNPPLLHGYDDAFVTESKVPTYDPMRKPFHCDGRFWDYLAEGDAALPYGTFYWNIRGTKVTDRLQGDDSRIIIDHALPFMEEAIDNELPFFSVVWFHAPHMPCVAGPEHAALYPDCSLEERNYYGCITAMDEQIGRLVDFLKSKGAYEHTIFLFCSDNGPELNTPGSAGSFRGKKRSLYEGGIRVPAFMVWKEKIASPKVMTEPCFTSDYLPSLLDILDLKKPEGVRLDGESFWPLVMGKSVVRSKPLVFCSERQGAVIQGQHKLYYSEGTYELYDLMNDPMEQHNIAAKDPVITETLTKIWMEQMASYEHSFRGDEYGTRSYEKVPQQWHDVTNK